MANPASIIMSGTYPLPTDNNANTTGRLYNLLIGAVPYAFLRDNGSSWDLMQPFGWVDVMALNINNGDPAANATLINNQISSLSAVGGGIMWFRPGSTVVVTTLNLQDNVWLCGNMRGSVLSSTANAPIITVPTTASNAGICGLTIKGSVTAGGSQDGIYATGNGDYAGLVLRDLWIQDCGNHGLRVDNRPFSVDFNNIHVTNCADYPFLFDTTYAPGIVLRNSYAHILRASATTAYRIRSGIVRLENCNGTDSVPPVAGTKWAVVGKKNGVDGDVAHGGAKLELVNCNLEAFDTHGVLLYYHSTVSCVGHTLFAGNVDNPNKIGIEFDLANNGTDYFAAYLQRGYLEDQVDFQDGVAAYKNSQPIHANGFAPLQTRGQGPLAGNTSAVRVHSYRNATAGADMRLARADGGFYLDKITGSKTYSVPGVRWIEVNHSAPCTVTLPWAGDYQNSQETVIVSDFAGVAGTHNITINSGGGGTVNGGSVTLNVNKQSVILAPDNGTQDWRIVGKYL